MAMAAEMQHNSFLFRGREAEFVEDGAMLSDGLELVVARPELGEVREKASFRPAMLFAILASMLIGVLGIWGAEGFGIHRRHGAADNESMEELSRHGASSQLKALRYEFCVLYADHLMSVEAEPSSLTTADVSLDDFAMGLNGSCTSCPLQFSAYPVEAPVLTSTADGIVADFKMIFDFFAIPPIASDVFSAFVIESRLRMAVEASDGKAKATVVKLLKAKPIKAFQLESGIVLMEAKLAKATAVVTNSIIDALISRFNAGLDVTGAARNTSSCMGNSSIEQDVL